MQHEWTSSAKEWYSGRVREHVPHAHMVILVKLRVGAHKSVFNGIRLENCEDGEISFLFGSALASSDQRDE